MRVESDYIKQQVSAAFTQVFAAGWEQGRRDALSNSPAQSDNHIPWGNGRAPFGAVQRLTEEVLKEAGTSLTSSGIVEIAKMRQENIKPHSVRLGLYNLERLGKVKKVGCNEWQHVEHAPSVPASRFPSSTGQSVVDAGLESCHA